MDLPVGAPIVVVGSGLGGYSLARELRKLDPEAAITVVTADGGELYSKPMLSNALAQGKDVRSLTQKTAERTAADLRLTVLPRHRALAIDRRRHVLSVAGSDGTAADLAYHRLVLAVGADPRPCPVEGADPAVVHSVNDLDDYAAWREGLGAGTRVLLIGAGLIGCEFANDLVTAGCAVTLVDPAPWPLGRLLPADLGDSLAAALAAAGVSVHTDRSVQRVTGTLAVLDDGTVVGFDRILTATGLLPRSALAAAAGLAVDRGVVVDRHLRTSDPDIFAIGDCAQTDAGPLPFVLPLMAQARAVAATLAGKPTALRLPALPVVVKTPCLPIVVCPPPAGTAGTWQIEGDRPNLKALFVDRDGDAIGFALAGAATAEAQRLAKTMPPQLA